GSRLREAARGFKSLLLRQEIAQYSLGFFIFPFILILGIYFLISEAVSLAESVTKPARQNALHRGILRPTAQPSTPPKNSGDH
ncbi:MAG: hypothetical protein Q4F18_09895, partial [Clostridia bacterium]|nr:hypothetical protein [Clostridia bacterium]